MTERKLSDRRVRLFRSARYPAGRLQLYVEWRDLWVGAFVPVDAVYLVVFTLVCRWSRRAAETN